MPLRRAIQALGLCFGLVVGSVLGQPVSHQSAPLDLAKAAMGRLPGTVVVGLWRDKALRVAGMRDGQVLDELALTGPNAPLFEIGSISKVFTGLLLAQAEEAGDLSVDDTLAHRLEGQVVFSSPAVAGITLGQLVTHTACLPRLPADFRQGADPANPYQRYDRARMWAALASLQLPKAPPCDPVYSNWSLALLGEVLSVHDGKPWEVLVRERITQPLGMTDTVQTLGDKAPRLAPMYAGEKAAQPWEFQAFAGAGALRSTLADLITFGRALHAGRDGPLGAAAVRWATPLARFNGQIGRAVFVRGPAERRSWSHNGEVGGFRAEFVVAADSGDVAVLLASNSQAETGRVVGELATERYPPPPARPDLDPGPVLGDYAGVYRHTDSVRYTVTVAEGRLQLRVTGQGFTAMQPAGPDQFTDGRMRSVVFTRQGGRVNALTVSAQGADHPATRTADETVPPIVRLPDAVLQPLVGRYEGGGLRFDVQARDGQLVVQVRGQPRVAVFPVPGQPDRFAYDVVRAELQFHRHGNGQASELVLFQNGELHAARVDGW